MAVGKKSFLFGKVEGSISNLISTTDKAGRTILREKPTSVANPRTIGQVNRREKFTKINSLASLFIAIIARGFRNQPNRNVLHTPRNRFMSYNLKHAFSGAEAETLSLPDIRLGLGDLVSETYSNVVLKIEGEELNLSLNKSGNVSTGNASPTDKSIFFAIREDDFTLVPFPVADRVDNVYLEDAFQAPEKLEGTWYVIAATVTDDEFNEVGQKVIDLLYNINDKFIQSDFLAIGKFDI